MTRDLPKFPAPAATIRPTDDAPGQLLFSERQVRELLLADRAAATNIDLKAEFAAYAQWCAKERLIPMPYGTFCSHVIEHHEESRARPVPQPIPLTDDELLDICRQQTNPSAVAKYGDSFLRISQAVQRAVLEAQK